MLQVEETLAFEVVSASYLENDVRKINPKTMVRHTLTNCYVSDPQIVLERFSVNTRTQAIPYKACVKQPPDKTLNRHVTN